MREETTVDPRTLTDRIAGEVRSSIESGDYGPGAALPSERELVDRYGASRGTVRRALAVLIHEGRVTSRSGLGYFVREFAPLDWWPGTFEHQEQRRDTASAGADAWAADVIEQGRTPRQEVDVSIIVPPSVVVARLGTPAGEMVVVRRRLRFVDDVPFQTADSYYPRDVAEGTPIMQPGDMTIPGGLMAAAGHAQVRFLDEITVRMPTQEEAFRLDLPTGTPVAEHLRTGFNRDGRPVRTIITIVPGDRHRIMYDVPAAAAVLTNDAAT